MKYMKYALPFFISICVQLQASTDPFDDIHKRVMAYVLGENAVVPKVNSFEFRDALRQTLQDVEGETSRLHHSFVEKENVTPRMITNLVIKFADSLNPLSTDEINILLKVLNEKKVASLDAVVFWLPRVQYMWQVGRHLYPMNALTSFDFMHFILDCRNYPNDFTCLENLFNLFCITDTKHILERFNAYKPNSTVSIINIQNGSSKSRTSVSIQDMISSIVPDSDLVRSEEYGLAEWQLHHEREYVVALMKLIQIKQRTIGFVDNIVWFSGVSVEEAVVFRNQLRAESLYDFSVRLSSINRIIDLLSHAISDITNLFGYLVSIEHIPLNVENLFVLLKICSIKHENLILSKLLEVLNQPDIDTEMDFHLNRQELGEMM